MFNRYNQNDKDRGMGRPAPDAAFSTATESLAQTATSKFPKMISTDATPRGDTHLRPEIHRRAIQALNLSAIESATEEELKSAFSQIISEILAEKSLNGQDFDTELLIDDLYDDVRGLGPLEPLMRDPSVTDILVNGPAQVFVEREGRLHHSAARFRDESHLARVVDKIVSSVGRRIDESTPYVDARLMDGSRLNAVISPIAIGGPFVSIRKSNNERITINELIKFGSIDEISARYFEAAVGSRLNIAISGGTGSGKTTLLNALSAYINSTERIITIEDTAELRIQHPHVVSLETRTANIEGRGKVTQRDCLINALRMRPDRIIIGETRGAEVIDMLQSMNTGHDGSMTTIHANSPRDAIVRIETMFSMAGIDFPLRAIRSQIASALNVVIQVSRHFNGKRIITSISEITGMEGETISMQEIYFRKIDHTDQVTGTPSVALNGIATHFSRRFKDYGFDISGIGSKHLG